MSGGGRRPRPPPTPMILPTTASSDPSILPKGADGTGRTGGTFDTLRVMTPNRQGA
jgi:hypothetical protein